ncbi:uncharacterized protein EDB91DRAFT_35356 [Suillus paluster]|uniref:uncharacterized protein n=1 Tax=Suillus paluster TaxID=48578 RepID=UPI001B8805DD|nr:uncharacterized protein EDB91DRAFT_35356 [Suillus paluster]KAG1756778.1 hypothetical protein EDB91DRAFT_35356 [Suillus paluster]
MCHRQLRFTKNTACGHLTFQGDTYIDCFARDCNLSTSHPTLVRITGETVQLPSVLWVSHTTIMMAFLFPRSFVSLIVILPSQPQRLITLELPGTCPKCPQ